MSGKGSREVAAELDVNIKTLQLWVREGYVSPRTVGEGRQLRIDWQSEDVERAKRLRDRNGSTPLAAAFGPDLMAAMSEAWRMRDFRGDDDVIVCSHERGRVFRNDTTLKEVVRKMPGRVLVILK